MKRTPLYDEHVQLGGRIVDFAGWELPVMYSSIVEEHTATRTRAGLFDVSHMGEISVRGKGAAEYLSRMIPTRMDKLEQGKSMYSCFLNERGGVIDDLFVYMVSDEEYYFVVNAGTKDKDLQWMKDHAAEGVDIIDLSDETAKIDIQGPRSEEIVSDVLRDPAVQELKRFYYTDTRYNDHDIMVSKSGYTGEKGYELYVPNGIASTIWNALLEAGSGKGLKAAGLGARDSLRLEACYSLYGHELGEDISPVEGNIGWIISSSTDYAGKAAAEELKRNGAPRELVYFELTGKGVPREGCRVLYSGNDIGYATSAGFSPTLKKGIGFALVQSGTVKTGDQIAVVVRDRPIEAVLVNRPFYAFNG